MMLHRLFVRSRESEKEKKLKAKWKERTNERTNGRQTGQKFVDEKRKNISRGEMSL